MLNRRAATSIRSGGLLAALLLAAIAALAPSAVAGNAPGNNGTVKIHDGATENPAGEVRNEPHVCTFHLHFYFADPVQAGTWKIEAWTPTGDKGKVVANGTYDTSPTGEDRQPDSGVLSLPNGHYKLFWDGAAGKHAKMKTFWVECAPASARPSQSTEPSASASVQPSTAPSASASVQPSTAPSSSVAPSGGELPIVSSASPTSEVLDVVGTPPPTDSESAAVRSEDQGWRVILIALSAILATAAFLTPVRSVRPARPDGHEGR